MRWFGALLAFLGVIAPVLTGAVPAVRAPSHDPRRVSELPTFVQRMQLAVVDLRVRAPEDSPSAATLGAASIEARTRDDRVVELSVVRAGEGRLVPVRSIDRRQLFRTTTRRGPTPR